MNTYTPGPWKIVTFGEKNQYQDVQDAKNNSVCTKQNARLIAASPDLLEALEMILPYLEQVQGKDEQWQIAADAIAKAKGD